MIDVPSRSDERVADAAAGERWMLVGGFELHERRWDDQYAVFHAGSGDTHLLNHTGIEALRMLQRQPMTIDEVAEKLSPQWVHGSAQEVRQFVAELIQAFDRLGLIEPVT